MMKTLEEVFDEVAESEELQARFLAEQTAEGWVALVKELGGDTTVEEIAPYLLEWGNKEGKLPDERLEQVSGGSFGLTKLISADEKADYDNAIHPKCGGHIMNRWSCFKKCKCDKCGMESAWYDDFFSGNDTYLKLYKNFRKFISF